MWHKHWTLRKGFILGAAVIVIGLLLHWTMGNINWSLFSFPINLWMLLGFIGLILLLYFTISRSLVSFPVAVSTLSFAVVLTIMMGLTRQYDEGSGIHAMRSFWPFVLTYVLLAVMLGLTILTSFGQKGSNWFRGQKASAFLFHAGLFIVLITATLGNADIQRLQLVAVKGQPEWRAVDEERRVVELPFSIKLQDFIMEQYADGTPRRFASEVTVLSHGGEHVHAIVEVNKPLRVDGWKIYQFGYDTKAGNNSQMSIFSLVRDPWLPFVYIGISLMLLGALCMLLSQFRFRRSSWKPWQIVCFFLLMVAVFLLISLFFRQIHNRQLVPALQSPWFAPHILAYMTAYTCMAVATLCALCGLFSEKFAHWMSEGLEPRLVRAGFAILTIGMLFGALWAKEAWGHYWTWDPKETWALITWLSYLVYLHYRRTPNHNPRVALSLLVVSFLLLQMCWWGINLLPSAVETSIHIYK